MAFPVAEGRRVILGERRSATRPVFWWIGLDLRGTGAKNGFVEPLAQAELARQDQAALTRRGVEQWQLARLITWRSQVQILPPQFDLTAESAERRQENNNSFFSLRFSAFSAVKSSYTASKIVAIPCPAPMHIVARPSRALRSIIA